MTGNAFWEIFYTLEDVVVYLAETVLDYPEAATWLVIILVIVALYKFLRKFILKKHTTEETSYPELEKLKEVKTESKVDNKGHFLVALLRVFTIFAALILLYLLLKT